MASRLLLGQARSPQQACSPQQAGADPVLYIETKKKLAINTMPTNHTSERKIAQSAK